MQAVIIGLWEVLIVDLGKKFLNNLGGSENRPSALRKTPISFKKANARLDKSFDWIVLAATAFKIQTNNKYE